jgi:hypothetical protein
MNSIRGVEIFSTGEWNGDKYSEDDLKSIVQAFGELSPGIKPYIKLGHDPKQTLLQNDGLPSAGWIERVYIDGNKLLADFIDIPQKVYDLIQKKAYRKVSSEIYWNLKRADKTYSRVLAGVALLGSDMPGVMNLNDILAMYKDSGMDIHIYEFDELNFVKENQGKGTKMSKTEQEIKLELDLEMKEKLYSQEQEKAKKLTEEKEAQEKELQELKQFKLEAEKKQKEQADELEKVRIEKFVTELVTEKLCTPAMKPLIAELVGPEKKEYTSLKDKKLNKEELLKEALKLFKVI